MIIKKNGFSLIELMIVVAIMGLLISIAIPYFSSWMLNSRVRNVAESIHMAIIKARAESVKQGEKVILDINQNTGWVLQTQKIETVINAEDIQEVVNGGNILDKKDANYSSFGVSLEIIPSDANKITFASSGNLINNYDGSSIIEEIKIKTVENRPDISQLKILITKGGASIICIDNQPPKNNDLDCSNQSFVFTEIGEIN